MSKACLASAGCEVLIKGKWAKIWRQMIDPNMTCKDSVRKNPRKILLMIKVLGGASNELSAASDRSSLPLIYGGNGMIRE